MVLRTILSFGWSPVVITALAVVGFIYQWPIEILGPALGVILAIGLVTAITTNREKGVSELAHRIRRLAGYFNRRFTGDSSLSIFVIIDSLFAIENPKLWDWARACSISRRVFNTWSDSFVSRVESDTRTGRSHIYLRTCLNELWLMSNHYYEFIEQFHEIAEKVELPQEIVDQYTRFVTEYNAFAQNFRDSISELKKFARTEIEPPSVKFAPELAAK
jgi:hypothetical protein